MTDSNMTDNNGITDSISDDVDLTNLVDKARLVFPKITKEIYTLGVPSITHPFMDDPTEQEMAFARLLAFDKPFITKILIYHMYNKSVY
jgi:hypothetical protein